MTCRNHPDPVLFPVRVGHDKEPSEAVSAQRNKLFITMNPVYLRECKYVRKYVFHVGKVYLVPLEVKIASDGIVNNFHGSKLYTLCVRKILTGVRDYLLKRIGNPNATGGGTVQGGTDGDCTGGAGMGSARLRERLIRPIASRMSTK